MTNILVYDIEAEELEKLAEENDTTVAELVCEMVEYIQKTLAEKGNKSNFSCDVRGNPV